MKQWNDTIGMVFGIINEALYSLALFKEIGPKERNEKVFDPILRRFWVTISNNAIQMAAINWCKIFGAERNNKTYYSHFVDKDQFLNRLNDISFDEESRNMRNFRDKFAVHADDKKTRLPLSNFEKAIQIMEAFKDTVQEEYDIPLLPSMRGNLEAYQLQIRDCLYECRIDWTMTDQE